MHESVIPRLPLIDADAPDAEQRSTFIGASEGFETTNTLHYGRGCERALYYRKTQTPPDIPSGIGRKEQAMSQKGILRRGHILEGIYAQLIMEKTGRTLVRRNYLVRHPDHPGAACHPDRIVLGGSGRNTGIAEIKTHNEHVFLNILRTGIPAAYGIQLQWGMWCAGYDWGMFIVGGVFGDLPVKYFDVERDDELHKIFAIKVDNFWNMVAKRDPPPQLPDADDIRCKCCPWRINCRGIDYDPAAYQRVMDERDGKRVLTEINNPELDEAISDRALILGEIQALDHDDEEDPGALQLVNARIRELVGDIQAAAVNRHWKLYVSDGTWSGLDIKRLHTEQPDIYDKFSVKGRPTGKKVIRVYAMNHEKAER